MKLLIDIADVDNLIIGAIESTDKLCDNWNGPESDVWEKVYDALKQLRAKAVDLREAAKQEGYYIKTIADAEHAGEYL